MLKLIELLVAEVFWSALDLLWEVLALRVCLLAFYWFSFITYWMFFWMKLVVVDDIWFGG